jgi:DNA-binding CsgD family transcriptional regulator
LAIESSARLLEREPALAVLSEALLRADQDRGRTVAVTGEAGVGKSSVLNAFADAVGTRATVMWGQCEPLHTARALGPLHDFASELGSGVIEALRAQSSTFSVFDAALHAIHTNEKPIVMVLEDVHWADEGTLDFIRFLSRRVGRLPLCLILSFRSDEVGPEHPLRLTLGDVPGENLRRIALTPLSIDAVAQMSGKNLRDVESLYRATAGNPFYVTEALANSEQTLPHSVRDAVLARLSRLDEAERQVMNVVCVSPGRVARAVVQDVLGPSSVAQISTCLQRGVLVQDGDTVHFRHELARLATLSALSATEQQALHQRVLDVYLRSSSEDVSRMLHHALAVDDPPLVLKLAREAAAQSAALGAHKQAAAHYLTALNARVEKTKAEQASLLGAWSYVAALSKIDDAAIDARHRAIALWREEGDAAQVAQNLRWLSRLHWYRGESERADRFIEESVQMLADTPACEEKAWGLSSRAQMHMLRGRNDEAKAWGERAIEMAQAVGSTEVHVHAMNTVGCALLFGQLGDGLPLLQKSLALSVEHKHHEQAARAYTNIVSWAVEQRQLPLAERYAREGLEFDQKHDLDSWTHYLEGVYAQVLLQLGRLDEAAEIAESALDVPDLTQVMRMPALNVLATIAVRRGYEDAAARVDDVLRFAHDTQESQRLCPALMVVAEKAWVDNQPEQFAQALAALSPPMRSSFSVWHEGELRVWAHHLGIEFPWTSHNVLPEYFQNVLNGNVEKAAAAWQDRAEPYFQALVLAGGDDDQLLRAIAITEELNVSASSARLRELASARGVRTTKRGPYATSRGNSFGISVKELDVLRLMAVGRTNNEIAEELFRSPKTVEHHSRAVIAKLGAKNRVEASAKARDAGLLAA